MRNGRFVSSSAFRGSEGGLAGDAPAGGAATPRKGAGDTWQLKSQPAAIDTLDVDDLVATYDHDGKGHLSEEEALMMMADLQVRAAPHLHPKPRGGARRPPHPKPRGGARRPPSP